ncbi:MAG: pyruvate kinase [Chloroflexota bacterium]
MIHTKIVCTIGPASRDPAILAKLIEAGMDVARLNFSHGDQAYHGENIRRIRAAAQEAGVPVAIMVDLQGPKIRVGELKDDGFPLNEGECVILTTHEVVGERLKTGDSCAVVPVRYTMLCRDVKPGERILIDDGLIELRVDEIREEEISTTVITGGPLKNHKGVNLPNSDLSVPAITEQDWDNLDFALSQDADWIALSFVRRADEVRRLKAHIVECGGSGDYCARVIAKIEKPEALDYIDEIMEAADGIMVARGDLGIEIPAEQVPMVQKRLIREANAAAKPVITATQMLDSMIRNPRPTRAEASDVANAILDGTDATMLSGETAVGKYPVEAVRTMARIAHEVENAVLPGDWNPPSYARRVDDVTHAVSHATCDLAEDVHAAAIITSTASGKTARAVASYRPNVQIIAATPHPIVQRQLMLSWGVLPLASDPSDSTDRVVRQCIQLAAGAGAIKNGDRVVLTAGVAANMPGSTNLIRVEKVEVES